MNKPTELQELLAATIELLAAGPLDEYDLEDKLSARGFDIPFPREAYHIFDLWVQQGFLEHTGHGHFALVYKLANPLKMLGSCAE